MADGARSRAKASSPSAQAPTHAPSTSQRCARSPTRTRTADGRHRPHRGTRREGNTPLLFPPTSRPPPRKDPARAARRLDSHRRRTRQKLTRQDFPGIQGGPLMHVSPRKPSPSARRCSRRLRNSISGNSVERPRSGRAFDRKWPDALHRRHGQPFDAPRPAPAEADGPQGANWTEKVGLTTNKNDIPTIPKNPR